MSLSTFKKRIATLTRFAARAVTPNMTKTELAAKAIIEVDRMQFIDLLKAMSPEQAQCLAIGRDLLNKDIEAYFSDSPLFIYAVLPRAFMAIPLLDGVEDPTDVVRGCAVCYTLLKPGLEVALPPTSALISHAPPLNRKKLLSFTRYFWEDRRDDFIQDTTRPDLALVEGLSLVEFQVTLKGPNLSFDGAIFRSGADDVSFYLYEHESKRTIPVKAKSDVEPIFDAPGFSANPEELSGFFSLVLSLCMSLPLEGDRNNLMEMLSSLIKATEEPTKTAFAKYVGLDQNAWHKLKLEDALDLNSIETRPSSFEVETPYEEIDVPFAFLEVLKKSGGSDRDPHTHRHSGPTAKGIRYLRTTCSLGSMLLARLFSEVRSDLGPSELSGARRFPRVTAFKSHGGVAYTFPGQSPIVLTPYSGGSGQQPATKWPYLDSWITYVATLGNLAKALSLDHNDAFIEGLKRYFEDDVLDQRVCDPIHVADMYKDLQTVSVHGVREYCDKLMDAEVASSALRVLILVLKKAGASPTIDTLPSSSFWASLPEPTENRIQTTINFKYGVPLLGLDVFSFKRGEEEGRMIPYYGNVCFVLNRTGQTPDGEEIVRISQLPNSQIGQPQDSTKTRDIWAK